MLLEELGDYAEVEDAMATSVSFGQGEEGGYVEMTKMMIDGEVVVALG